MGSKGLFDLPSLDPIARPSRLHGPAFDAHGGLAQGFGAGGVGVAGAGDVFRGGGKLHGHTIFANHLTDLRPDHMGAEDAVGGGVGQDLHKAFRLVIDLGAAIGGKGEFTDLIGNAGGL